MNKGLEALKNIKREAGTPYFSTLYDIDMWHEDFATVETELKALEIIEEKVDDMEWLRNAITANFSLERYNDVVECNHGERLTKEEYDLLKEWLK